MSASNAYNLKGTLFERMTEGKYKTILKNVEYIVKTLFNEYSSSYTAFEDLELDLLVDDASDAIKMAPAPQKMDILYDAVHGMIDTANEALEAQYNFINANVNSNVSSGFTRPTRRFIDKKPILASLDKMIQEKQVKANLSRTSGKRNLLKARRHMRKTRKSRKSRKSRR
jgi:hypothetical protein